LAIPGHLSRNSFEPFVLAYLAAAQILRPAHFGVRPVGSDQPVNAFDLAATLFTATLFDLRDCGALALSLSHSKVLCITSTWAGVARTAQPHPVDETDAAGRVYACATPSARSVSDVVKAWIGTKSPDPCTVVLNAAHAETLALGLIVPQEQTFAPATGLADTVAGCAQRVRGWAQTDADLYAQVMKDAAGGIAAMREAREGELFQ
jgi:hypothetical protein